MTVEERIATFLLQNKGKAYCDDCLAKGIGVNRHQARNATSGLGASGTKFQRDYGTCSKTRHDREKKVIQVCTFSRP
jgi:hypothetical protein